MTDQPICDTLEIEPKFFQPGDVVTLKSGGPSLTVSWSNPDVTGVVWISKSQEVQEHDFSTACLRSY